MSVRLAVTVLAVVDLALVGYMVARVRGGKPTERWSLLALMAVNLTFAVCLLLL